MELRFTALGSALVAAGVAAAVARRRQRILSVQAGLRFFPLQRKNDESRQIEQNSLAKKKIKKTNTNNAEKEIMFLSEVTM